MEKIGLVLEGGGMRGAYTAGVLSWLIDQSIEFDYIVGISSGAMYAAMFAIQDKDMLYRASTQLAGDSRNVGFKAFLREGTPVGYNFLFDAIIDTYHFDLEKLDQFKGLLEVGVYDIAACETIWKNQHDIAQQPDYLKAACTLPLAGRAVKIGGKKYMDGGITTMVPIQHSLDAGCVKHLVVTTKDKDFVRKPNGKGTQLALDLVYHKHKQLLTDFRARTEVYYQERSIVDDLVADDKAILLYPTVKTSVKRTGGTVDEFILLYQNAYQDCEDQKEQIFRLLK